MSALITKDWQSFAEYEYQLENWIRWGRDLLRPEGTKPPGWVNLIEHEPEYREAKRDPVWILDAEKFDNAVINLPRRGVVVMKLHYLNRYINDLGQIKFTNDVSKKAKHLAVSRATYYREVSKYEDLLKKMLKLEREVVYE